MGSSGSEKRFIGVYFIKCRAYGRLYKNQKGDAYVGRCPVCGFHVRVRIGSEGVNTRFLECICP